jgi:hypothetical protein
MQFGIALYDALVGANIPASKAVPLVQAMGKELIERLDNTPSGRGGRVPIRRFRCSAPCALP